VNVREGGPTYPKVGGRGGLAQKRNESEEGVRKGKQNKVQNPGEEKRERLRSAQITEKK